MKLTNSYYENLLFINIYEQILKSQDYSHSKRKMASFGWLKDYILRTFSFFQNHPIFSIFLSSMAMKVLHGYVVFMLDFLSMEILSPNSMWYSIDPSFHSGGLPITTSTKRYSKRMKRRNYPRRSKIWHGKCTENH